jgi:hypothetical protein
VKGGLARAVPTRWAGDAHWSYYLIGFHPMEGFIDDKKLLEK